MYSKKFFYFCTNCSCEINRLEEGFLVDEHSKRLFCSEECIVEHFEPLINFYYDSEQQHRMDLALEDEDVAFDSQEHRQDIIDACLTEPSEVWKVKSDIGEEYYSHILYPSEGFPYFTILVVFIFAGKPSFVLHHVFTKSEALCQRYKWGHSDALAAENSGGGAGHLKNEELVLPRDVIEEVDRMRSQFIAELISMRSDNDIPIENFPQYDMFLESTLSEPDEVFEYDDNGSRISVQIRNFQGAGGAFFFFAVCLKLGDELKEKKHQSDDVLIPILSFPSVDQNVYAFYRKGQCLTKRHLN